MSDLRRIITIGFSLLWLLNIPGCATAPSAGPGLPDRLAVRVQARITPLVEALYLNSRQLEEIFRDLRSTAQGHALAGADRQLNYVQKTALYVHKAQRSAAHHWEMLSLMDDIRPSALVDYYTLRHRGLRRALNEAIYDQRFIRIYQTQISHVATVRDVDKALALIEANATIFTQLIKAISAVARRQGPAESL